MPRKPATFKKTLPLVNEYEDDLNEMNATVSATSLHKLEDV